MKKQNIYSSLVLLCLSTALYSKVELTYTQSSVGDQWHSNPTRITIHLESTIENREGTALPVANLLVLDEPIYNLVISLGPTEGFIMWKKPDGTEAAVPLSDVRPLFYILYRDSLKLDSALDISHRANSTDAIITSDTNSIKLDSGLSEVQRTTTISPFEQGPVWLKFVYNEVIGKVKTLLPEGIPLIFTEMPIGEWEHATQYIKEIPTRIKYAAERIGIPLGYY
jgi:hypothetical protein